MTFPSAVLGLMCALLMGTVFHLVVDGGPARLLLCVILSTTGFSAGQWVASSRGWLFLPVGPLQLGPAILGSLLFLAVGHWLSKVKVQAVDRTHTI